jgi:hypothetical protein
MQGRDNFSAQEVDEIRSLIRGQLPFDVVITRGGNFKGLDQIYLEIAKTSFNYLLVGGIVGSIVGAIAGMKITKNISNKTM